VSLATELRPTSLDEVIGQDNVVRALKQMFAGQIQYVPKAILFSGPPGVGKTTLARIIAGMLKAEVEELNASDKSGVDDARQLAERAGYRPLSGKFRVVILDEVQRMTTDAQNVLLKPTEADNTATLWIFCTTSPNKLIKPLRDRCVEFELRPLYDTSLDKLFKRAGFENNLLFNALLKKYEGRVLPRVALNAIEKVMAGLSVEESVQNLDEDPEYIEIARTVSKGDWPGTAKLLKEFKGTDVQGVVRVCKGYLKTMLLSGQGREVQADVILGLSQYVGLYADMADLAASLYRACKKLGAK
jgi:replication-associated recombination protein RarA